MQQSGYCDRKGCMMGMKMLLLAVLMEVTLVLADHRKDDYIPGAPVNISKDDPDVQQALVNATYLYNNQSNDVFLFKPSAIIRAQRQIVKGFKYLIDFQISRTVCHKRDTHVDLSRCNFQPKGLLQQTFQCHFEVWLVPWEKIYEVVLSCKS